MSSPLFKTRNEREQGADSHAFEATGAPQPSPAATEGENLQQSNTAAEATAARLKSLQMLAEKLESAMSRAQVAEIIADHFHEMLPNCKAMVAMLSTDGQNLDCVRGTGHSNETLERFDRKPLTFSSPITDAVQRQSPILISSPEEFRIRYPLLATFGAADFNTVCAAPFLVEGRAIGGLSLRFDRTTEHALDDMAFILHVARGCTQYLERTRLHEAEKAARAATDKERLRLSLLAEATALLNTSLDAPTIVDALAHVTVPRFAEGCVICRIAENGLPEFEHAVHDNPEMEARMRQMRQQIPFGPNHAITQVANTGKSKLLTIDDSELDRISVNAEHREQLNAIPATSSLVVPLAARDQKFGVLSFITSIGAFNVDDLKFAEELAHRAAIALYNARLYHEAQEANRVKDEFLGIVSHELRTPLNAILGWARMLRTGAVREGAHAKALEAIERNAAHQAKLIDDLLDASRITHGKLRLDATTIDLGPVVDAAIQSVTPAATAKEIRIQLTSEPIASPIFGDPSRLQQIVWNLLSNAIKFTPKGGHVDVRLLRENGEVLLIVSDSGRGIRPELLPHVFDRFRQGDGTLTRHSGGLGLGLSIVRHLVEAHGGTVQANSDGPDTGATFTVRLPVSNPKPIVPTSTAAAQDLSTTRKLTSLDVLVIDDEPDARDLLDEVLSLAGATVKTAADAAEALRILSDFTPDVIISDLAMPGEDGLSMMRKIRARAPDRVASVPAIALTAYTRTEDRVAALNAGFQLHVPKPVDPSELVATISSLRTLIS